MMQLKRKTFVAIVVLALVTGGGVGVLATGRAAETARDHTVIAPSTNCATAQDGPIEPCA